MKKLLLTTLLVAAASSASAYSAHDWMKKIDSNEIYSIMHADLVFADHIEWKIALGASKIEQCAGGGEAQKYADKWVNDLRNNMLSKNFMERLFAKWTYVNETKDTISRDVVSVCDTDSDN